MKKLGGAVASLQYKAIIIFLYQTAAIIFFKVIVLAAAVLSLIWLNEGRVAEGYHGLNYSGAASRIVGGKDALRGDYSFMAALNTLGQPLTAGHFCGACLIHPDWVLTAAHCLYDRPHRLKPENKIEVVLNLYDLRTDEGDRFQVKRMIIHPAYNFMNDNYDFALLELNRSAENYHPVVLYQGNDDLAGETATVLGWGEIYDKSFADILQEVQMQIVSNEECNQAFNLDGGYGYYPITANMLCAGSPGKDACFGDSGGPLLVKQNHQRQRLAGIVSWGPIRCASPELYGVYARIDQALDFINRYVPLTDYPALSAAPAAYSYGWVETNQIHTQEFTITNLGKANLMIEAVYLSPETQTEFNILDNSCTETVIKPSETCRTQVTFESPVTGVFSSQLIIISNDPDLQEFIIVLSAVVKENTVPPSAAAGNDRTVLPGERVELDGSLSFDLNGDIISYQWSQISGPEVVLSADKEAQAWFIAPATGDNHILLEFELTVVNQSGLTSADRVVITVQNRHHESSDNASTDDSAGKGITDEQHVTKSSKGCFLADIFY